MRVLSVVLFVWMIIGNPVWADDGLGVGDRAPEFALKDSKGKTYKLSDFKDKAVILEFIRSGSW